jgi:transaldolase
MSSKVVVKLPATREGLEAAARLSGEGVRTCVTAVYSPYQALLAAAAGAAFVAPYLGRMNDAGLDGHAMIAQMAEALRHTESATEILAASVRSPEDIPRLARHGVCHITLSPSVADMLFQEPLTLEATKAFEEAAQELGM